MRRYIITYNNKTADLLDQFETEAASINQAILNLRMKRFRFVIINIEVM